MDTKLKADIENVIQKLFNRRCETDDISWEGILHPELISQMVNACEQVFDSAMKAQEYYQNEMC